MNVKNTVPGMKSKGIPAHGENGPGFKFYPSFKYISYLTFYFFKDILINSWGNKSLLD